MLFTLRWFGLRSFGGDPFCQKCYEAFYEKFLYNVHSCSSICSLHRYTISKYIYSIYKDYISMLGELTCICTYVFHQSHSTKYSYVYTSYPGIFSMNTIQSMVINYILFFSIAILNWSKKYFILVFILHKYKSNKRYYKIDLLLQN